MSALEDVKISDPWLKAEELQTVFDVLCAKGGEARVAGGAVRNSLMGLEASDVDLCTTLLPDEVLKRFEAAGHKAIPTGIDHGTITVVVNDIPFEVTTLREDIETDGRHAVVKFGLDWEADAKRRDLTINGLFCDRLGVVYDYVGGIDDINTKTVRFIGEADTRIKEDALRILRFFRFFAWYGEGRPDASGLKACVANRDLISKLSAERIWMELKKILASPDPSRALLWMRTTGVLGEILPESAKWGIDAIPGLLQQEKTLSWHPDPMLRLIAIVRPHEETVLGLSKRLLLSNAETGRLSDWAGTPAPKPNIDKSELKKLIYQSVRQGLVDAMRLEIVHLQNRDDEAGSSLMAEHAAFAENWERPIFPVKGQDLLDLGMKAGPDVGEKLAELESQWVESGFNLSKDELLS